MADSKKSGGKRIVDVAHPGKTPASATSKPVIVGNRPILKDPMVVDEAVPEEEESTSPKNTGNTVIQPLTAPEVDKKDETKDKSPESDPEPDDSTDETDHSKTIAQLAEEARVKEEEQDIAPKSSDDESAQEQGSETSDDAQGAPNAEISKVEEAEEARKKKQEEELQKLTDSKQYYLPINTVEKRRSKRIVAGGVLLSVLLAVAWFDIAVDAGLLPSANSIPHTHFFKLTDSTVASAPAAKAKATNSHTATISSTRYISKADKATFAYPKTWKTSTTDVAGFPEWLGLEPTDAALKGQKGLFSLIYERNTGDGAGTTNTHASVETTDTSYTIASVSYRKLPSTAANVPLYIQQFVVQTKLAGLPKFMPYINLTSKNKALRVGEHITSANDVLSLPFVVNNEKDSLTFGGTMIPSAANGSAGTDTLEDAQTFMKGTLFKQATSILMSYKVPKH